MGKNTKYLIIAAAIIVIIWQWKNIVAWFSRMSAANQPPPPYEPPVEQAQRIVILPPTICLKKALSDTCPDQIFVNKNGTYSETLVGTDSVTYRFAYEIHQGSYKTCCYTVRGARAFPATYEITIPQTSTCPTTIYYNRYSQNYSTTPPTNPNNDVAQYNYASSTSEMDGTQKCIYNKA